MKWVVLCSVAVYLVAQLPLIYGLFALHGFGAMSKMWGIAPNQFWFLVFAFPLAAFATFSAARNLVAGVAPALPSDNPMRLVLENWLAPALACVLLASVLALADYFRSVKSFDKLHPQFATRAVEALEAASRPQDPIRRDRSVDVISEELSKLPDRNAAVERIGSLRPIEFLRVVQHPKLQLRYQIVHPVAHAFYTLEVLLVLCVALLAIFTAFATIATLKFVDGVPPPALSAAYRAMFAAIVCFSLFPICYRQYRSELEPYVGSEMTILPEVFAAIAVIAILIYLAGTNVKGQFEWSQMWSARLVPILLVGSGLALEARRPDIIRKLIGTQTNVGIQVIWAVIAVLVAIFLVFAALPHVFPDKK